MDTVIVLSPQYMDAVLACLGKYSRFCIAGYSEPIKGIEALNSIPGSKIIGFSYLNDYIRSDDIDILRQLLYKANIMFKGVVDKNVPESKIPFIFLLSTKLGGKRSSLSYVKAMIQDLNLDTISVGYYDYSMVTDLLIKVHMFGTILLKKRPFEVKTEEKYISENKTSHLSIDLPFDSKFIKIYDPLTFVEVDTFLKDYSDDKLLCMIRTYLYTKSDDLMKEINFLIDNMSFEERVPYEMCLRNLDLVRRDTNEIQK